MKRFLPGTLVWFVGLAAAGRVCAATVLDQVAAGADPAPPALQALEERAGWSFLAEDNICGLRKKHQLSNPAQVDWSALIDAAPETQEMKRKGIDPDSAKGIVYRQQAKERVMNACAAAMSDKRHCSVWKEISRKDGRKIDDITAAVLARLVDAADSMSGLESTHCPVAGAVPGWMRSGLVIEPV